MRNALWGWEGGDSEWPGKPRKPPRKTATAPSAAWTSWSLTHASPSRKVQDLIHKLPNRSRLPDPHGRRTGAPPWCHRPHTVGGGRTQPSQRRVEASEVQQLQQVTRSAEGGLPVSSCWLT